MIDSPAKPRFLVSNRKSETRRQNRSVNSHTSLTLALFPLNLRIPAIGDLWVCRLYEGPQKH